MRRAITVMQHHFSKILTALFLGTAVLIMGCTKTQAPKQVDAKAKLPIQQKLIDAVTTLPKSSILYYEDGLNITGLGINCRGYTAEYGNTYYWNAIEKMTGIHVDIHWKDEVNYTDTVATTLLSGVDNMPDIINVVDFGIMELAKDNTIIMLDDYLDLIPNIEQAVGKERMDKWKQSDGHIYTIPSIVNVPGAKTVMLRQDWLNKLGMKVPENWSDWLDFWRAVRDTDLNGNGNPSDEIPFACQLGANGEHCLLPLLNAFGIRPTNDCQFCILDNGSYTFIYEHPNYRAFLTMMQTLYKEKLIDQNFDSRPQDALFEEMNANRVASTYTWAEICRTSAQTLRDRNIAGALWHALPPIKGPQGHQMTPERTMVNNVWCLTGAAKKSGKVEDILAFFNWCFGREGIELYNYGIENVSYKKVNDIPVLFPEIVSNGFTDYRLAGCQLESFGGLTEKNLFMQCLFMGKRTYQMDELSQEFYNGIAIVNEGFFYSEPRTLQTDAYQMYRPRLITNGVCKLRNAAIKGEISIDDFFSEYEKLKKEGLQLVIDKCKDSKLYARQL